MIAFCENTHLHKEIFEDFFDTLLTRETSQRVRRAFVRPSTELEVRLDDGTSFFPSGSGVKKAGNDHDTPLSVSTVAKSSYHE